MNKEKWINEILQSAKAIQPVSSNPYMASRVEAKLQEADRATTMSPRWVFVSATVMVLILIVNISIWHGSTQPAQPSALQQLVHEYDLGNNDFYSTNYLK